MTELAYGQAKSAEEIGPIRQLQNEMDLSIDLLEKYLARLQAKLQPVLREEENVHAVPSSPREDLATSAFSRKSQEQVRRLDVVNSRLSELTSQITL